MDKDAFMQQVSDMRQQGASIRGIASQLGVHPGRVQRAVAKLSSPGTGTSNHNVSQVDQESVFVGREEELALLWRMLDESIAELSHDIIKNIKHKNMNTFIIFFFKLLILIFLIAYSPLIQYFSIN